MAEIGRFEVEEPGRAPIRSPSGSSSLWGISRSIMMAIGLATICIVIFTSMSGRTSTSPAPSPPPKPNEDPDPNPVPSPPPTPPVEPSPPDPIPPSSNKTAQYLLFEYGQQAATLTQGNDIASFTKDQLSQHSIKANVERIGEFDPKLVTLKVELEDELSQLLTAAGLTADQQNQVLEALSRAEAQLPNLNLPKDEPKKVEETFRTLLRGEVIRRLRDLVDSAMAEKEEFTVTKITTKPESAVTEEASEQVSLEPVYLHIDASMAPDLTQKGIESLKDRVGDPLPAILQESLAHTSESFENNVLPEPDAGSNAEETSFWLEVKVDELNFGDYLKHASGETVATSFKALFQELKSIEGIASLKMGSVLNGVCADLYRSMHVNIGPAIAQGLQNEININVKHQTQETYNAYSSWAQTGRCCHVGDQSFWVAAELLSKDPEQTPPTVRKGSFMARKLGEEDDEEDGTAEEEDGTDTAIPETLEETGKCPHIDVSRKCVGAGGPSSYRSPWVCSNSLITPAQVNITERC